MDFTGVIKQGVVFQFEAVVSFGGSFIALFLRLGGRAK